MKHKNNQVVPMTMNMPQGYTLLILSNLHNGDQFPILLKTVEQFDVIVKIKDQCEKVYKLPTTYNDETRELRAELTPVEIYDLSQLIRIWAN